MSKKKAHSISENCPIQPRDEQDFQNRNVQVPNLVYQEIEDFLIKYNREFDLQKRTEKLFFVDASIMLSDAGIKAKRGEVVLPIMSRELTSEEQRLLENAQSALTALHDLINNNNQ